MGEARITAVVVGVWSFACAGRLTGLILRADGTDPHLRISPQFRQYSVVRGRLLRIAEIKGRSSADAGRTWEWDRTQHEGVHLENHTVFSILVIPLIPV